MAKHRDQGFLTYWTSHPEQDAKDREKPPSVMVHIVRHHRNYAVGTEPEIAQAVTNANLQGFRTETVSDFGGQYHAAFTYDHDNARCLWRKAMADRIKSARREGRPIFDPVPAGFVTVREESGIRLNVSLDKQTVGFQFAHGRDHELRGEHCDKANTSGFRRDEYAFGKSNCNQHERGIDGYKEFLKVYGYPPVPDERIAEANIAHAKKLFDRMQDSSQDVSTRRY